MRYNSKPRIDLTGQRFGKLVVLEWVKRVFVRGERGTLRSGWRCQCDCGKQADVTTSNLAKRRISSCGCAPHGPKPGTLRKDRISVGVNCIICSYRAAARRAKVEWLLSFDAVKSLLLSDCHYCGAAPSNKRQLLRRNGDVFVYNGIDRMDNAQGYKETNVVTCCHTCNMRKADSSKAEFIAWAHAVAKRHPLAKNA